MAAKYSDIGEILEVAVLNIRGGQETAFEEAFAEAQSIICASPGYCGHPLRPCVEKPGRYMLLGLWETLAAHTIGFRQSAAYSQWKRLLHH